VTPFGSLRSSAAVLTRAAKSLGSKVMDEDELELDLASVTREEREERFSSALRDVYDDLDGDVLSLDDD
jgi:hypothetical protein